MGLGDRELAEQRQQLLLREEIGIDMLLTMGAAVVFAAPRAMAGALDGRRVAISVRVAMRDAARMTVSTMTGMAMGVIAVRVLSGVAMVVMAAKAPVMAVTVAVTVAVAVAVIMLRRMGEEDRAPLRVSEVDGALRQDHARRERENGGDWGGSAGRATEHGASFLSGPLVEAALRSAAPLTWRRPPPPPTNAARTISS